MGKRLRTTAALAVVVMLLVSACACSSVAVTGASATPPPGVRLGARRGDRRLHAGRGGRADGPDRLHRAGPGTRR